MAAELAQTRRELGSARQQLEAARQQGDEARKQEAEAKRKLANAETACATAKQEIENLAAEIERLKQPDANVFLEAGKKMNAGDVSGALQAYAAFVRDFPASPQVPPARDLVRQIIATRDRTWRSASGAEIIARYKPDAQEAAGYGNIPLLTSNERLVQIPQAKLSPEDQLLVSTLFGPNKVTPPPPPQTQLTPATNVTGTIRTWTTVSGNKISACYLPDKQASTGWEKVPLLTADGKEVQISRAQLSRNDQLWLADLAAKKRELTSSGPSVNSKLVLKASEFSTNWTILVNCRLLPNDANDGDSFHVKTQEGKEYIFRLHCVDAPESESDADVESRIQEQATYFGIAAVDVLRYGQMAAAFSASRLDKPFTVMTRFQNALGRSKLERFYAFVITATGEDLGHLLVANGLARAYGQSVEINSGSSNPISQRLDQLEADARANHRGIWEKSKR